MITHKNTQCINNIYKQSETELRT